LYTTKRSGELGFIESLFHNDREDLTSLNTDLVEVRGASSGIGSDLGSITSGSSSLIDSVNSISDSGVPTRFSAGYISVCDSLTILDSVSNLSSNGSDLVGNRVASSTSNNGGHVGDSFSSVIG